VATYLPAAARRRHPQLLLHPEFVDPPRAGDRIEPRRAEGELASAGEPPPAF
jgi:hypothetical protein